VPPPSTTECCLRQPQQRAGRALAYTILAIGDDPRFVIAVVVGPDLTSNSGDVNAPQRGRQTLDAARSILAGKGLKVGDVTRRFNRKVLTGEVIRQIRADLLLRRGEQ